MTRATLSAVLPEQMPAEIRAAWQTLQTLTGNAKFVEVFASSPVLLDFVMDKFYANIFFAGTVEARYKQLVRLKLSMMHGCLTCNLQNVPAALETGISRAQIDALDRCDSALFSDAEQALLQYTELLAIENQQQQVDNALLLRLQSHFTDAQICEIGLVAAVIGGLAKLSFVLDLVDQEPWCQFKAQ